MDSDNYKTLVKKTQINLIMFKDQKTILRQRLFPKAIYRFKPSLLKKKKKKKKLLLFFFTEIEKSNLKMNMESQGTLNSQNNLEKE